MLRSPARGHCTHNHPFVGNIEESCKRFITIEHEKNASSLAKCFSQHQSPLFSLPAELREIIYDYACRPSIDPIHLKTGPQCLTLLRMPVVWRADLGWLRTCRLIWLEANALVWRHAEPCFYRHSDPPDLYGFLYRLTALNTHRLKRLHIGQECHNLENNDGIRKMFQLTKLQAWPTQLTISLVAYPRLWNIDAIHTWVVNVLNEPKLKRCHSVDLVFHVPESQADDVLRILDALQQHPSGLEEWHVCLEDRDGKQWVREWNDIKLGTHWANRSDMPCRTFKLTCLALPATLRETHLTFSPDLEDDCWHLIPFRVMFAPSQGSRELDYAYADRLTESTEKQWEAKQSLLRFADCNSRPIT